MTPENAAELASDIRKHLHKVEKHTAILHKLLDEAWLAYTQKEGIVSPFSVGGDKPPADPPNP